MRQIMRSWSVFTLERDSVYMQSLYGPKPQGPCKSLRNNKKNKEVLMYAAKQMLFILYTSKPSFIIMSLSSNKGKPSVVLS